MVNIKLIAREWNILIPYIDYGLCEGCGACAEVFPDLFEMRGEKAWVINAGSFDQEKHPDIVQVCPFGAITLG